MPELDLEEIEKACAEATAGPWMHGAATAHGTVNNIFPVGANENDSSDGPDHIVVTDSGEYPPRIEDARFICGARTWVPDLVARVRELEAKVKEDCATAFRLGQRTMEEIESEREACAKVAESFEDLPPDANPGATAERIAREIRARGGK